MALSQRNSVPGADFGLCQMPGFWVRRANQMIRSHFAEECGAFGLTPEQYTILLLVDREETLDQTSVARSASLDLATTGNIVRRLVERGWVQRVRNPRDNRAWALSLTDEGRETLERARQRGRRVRERFLDVLTEPEAEEFFRLMRKLVQRD